MSIDIINKNADRGIKERKYIAGRETRYYVITIKIDSHQYLVHLLDGHSIVDSSDVHGRLNAAKKEGIRLLLQLKPDVTQSETTLVNYKDDRKKPWQKDSDKELTRLFNEQYSNPLRQIDFFQLEQILKQFAQYREVEENHYEVNERKYKDELLTKIGDILREVQSNPQKAKDKLIGLVAGHEENKSYRKYLQYLLGGYIWLDDFLVFLENTDALEFSDIFLDLFEQGIAVDIRERINLSYKLLFREGKFASSKKSIENMPCQLLAILLAAYDPDEYILYRPNDFGIFTAQFGLITPNDVVEKYELFNQICHTILRFSREKRYPVHDLIDAYNVVYMFINYEERFQIKYATELALEGAQTFMKNNQPKNLILYGPPGTGKTYNVIYQALSILFPDIDSDLINNPKRRAEAVTLFNRYVESNQIMFCTFHQSYSYEEFVEGIRFGEEQQRYEVRDGVFKQICNAARAVTTERKHTYNFDPEEIQFFKMSLGNTLSNDDEIYQYCMSNNVIALGWGEDVDYTQCSDKQEIRQLYFENYPDENKFGVEAMERFKNWMQQGDIVVISNGNTKARAIGKITGDYMYNPNTPIGYNHFRKVEWLYTDSTATLPVQSILRDKIFSQQTIYKFYDEDINIESIQELVSGNSLKSNQEQQFVLVIDEINRGNISKIFGELITLIEPDKRSGQPNEIPISLPYSGDRLRVPSNVHILGTMNTADRSIALLDTALRRRFEFLELMPDYSVLPTDVEGINIRKMLEVINERIEYMYDRDHVIGHSYFIVENLDLTEYIRIMKTKVIPLLQEYFYEDWEQIERVLGGAGKVGDTSYLLNKVDIEASNIFAKTTGLPRLNKTRYMVQSHPTPDSLKRIYSEISNYIEQGNEE
ncbi:MAG: AAA family ATPase [Bacillota bacterium]